MIALTRDKRMLGYESLNSYSNISHFVTTRHKGFSEGAYATFNCSPYTNDSSISVLSNQTLVMVDLKGNRARDLIIPFQGHSTRCFVIDDVYLAASREMRMRFLQGIDAVITDKPGYCICVTTADCVPILLYDKRLHAIAAIHAGWRGTVKHIVRSVVERMNKVYGTQGEDIVACIGPSISLKAFEVGKEVYDAFCEAGFDMASISLIKRSIGKYHIDLWEANRSDLIESGVPADQIELANICSYTQHKDFFSARRLGIDSGRTLSGIMINDPTVKY